LPISLDSSNYYFFHPLASSGQATNHADLLCILVTFSRAQLDLSTDPLSGEEKAAVFT